MEASKKDTVGQKFLRIVNPWALIFEMGVLSFVFIATFAHILQTLNYFVPQYKELQYVEGTVEKFDYGPGGVSTVFCELYLEEGGCYNMSKYIALYMDAEGMRHPGLTFGLLKKGVPVEIWIDPDYKEHFPNQIYAMNINGEKYFSYDESVPFLFSFYYDGAKSGLKWIFTIYIICMVVCILFFFKIKNLEKENTKKN